MKAKQIKLLAAVFTLAAVLAMGVNEAAGQRRSTGNTNTGTREQNSSVQNRSGSGNTRSSTGVNQDTNTRNRQTRVQQNTNTRREPAGRPSATQNNSNTRRNEQAAPQINRNRPQTSPARQPQNNTGTRNGGAVRENRRNNEYNSRVNNPNARRDTENARRIYRLDENDNRYRPNNGFKGNNQYWSYSNRPDNMNYNRNDRDFYHNYNYRSYNHWDRQWETYNWNLYSWRDYYRAYNPYSYRFSRFYTYHPVYGHVIKRFTVRPIIFNHHNIRYYCYDGHFFRHLRGVGYVLVDIPFGITFSVLRNYERVHINGDLYFRVGNLFFERTNFGFVLIHYPERYYALDEDFRNEGYYFDDDIYW